MAPMTDREAAMQQVAGRFDEFGVMESSVDLASVALDALWPLICQAREDGRREAEQCGYERGIEEMRQTLDALEAARLARGARQPGKENPDG